MYKKSHIAVVLLTLLSLFVSGCQKEEPILIGFIGTLTGVGSDLSVSGRRGIELAVEILNSQGGINGQAIELVYVDDENSAEKAIEGAAKLINQGIKYAIGPFTSGIAIELVNYTNQNEFLLLGPTISADELSNLDDYFIRFIASTKEQATILGKMAIYNKHKTIVIVYDKNNKGFTDALVKNYVEFVQEGSGANIITFAYNPKKMEERQQILYELEKINPEALFLVASAEESALLAKESKQVNPNLQLYGPLWANTSELIKKGGRYVEGMILVGAIDLLNTNERMDNFIEAYKQNFGEMPSFSSLYAYDATMVLAEALKESKSKSSSDIRKYILVKKHFDSLEEKLEFSEYGDCTRDYKLFQVNEARMVRVPFDE